MNFKQLWQGIRRYRLRTISAILLASIRSYGWVTTAKKIQMRMRTSKAGVLRKYRLLPEYEPADVSVKVFSRPTVLIVGAIDLPQCKKYRVLQKVEFFKSIGWEAYYTHYLDEPRVISYLQISTAVIFYRIPFGATTEDYLKESSRLGLKTFYDIDDPIFNLAVYRENKNLDHIEANERAHLLRGSGDYREAMEKVDALILSTNYLKELAFSDLKKPAFLWGNLADSATLSMIERIKCGHNSRNAKVVVIGYASGSRAHDEDFNIVSSALVKILDAYEHVELQVIGYASLPQELMRFKERINERPFSGYYRYLEALSQIDINIVPLVSDRFNACKSAIRYIEASVCGVPTIASSIGQFSEIIENGRDGYLADSHESWILTLQQLVENQELRLLMASAANNKVMTHHTISSPDVVDKKLLEQFGLPNE